MPATNITLKIDAELAKAARVLAAQRGSSISRLIAEELERLVRRDHAYQAARQRAVLSVREAAPLGWTKPATRDDLHERR